MTARADLPRLDDLPIPEDVQPGRTWPASMVEMADHIGAFDTLRVSEALGGQQIYISRDASRSPFADFLDDEKLETLAHVYGGSQYEVPTGAKELRAARRDGVIAAIRVGEVSLADAVKILRTSRTYLSYLVNRTDAGRTAAPTPGLRARRHVDPRQIDLFER